MTQKYKDGNEIYLTSLNEKNQHIPVMLNEVTKIIENFK